MAEKGDPMNLLQGVAEENDGHYGEHKKALYSLVTNFNKEALDNVTNLWLVYGKWKLTRRSAITMLKELEHDIINFKENAKKVKYVSSGVGVGSGVAAAIASSIILSPFTGGLSLAATALASGGSVLGIVSGVTSIATNYFENKKMHSYNDRILEILKEDESQLHILLKMLKECMIMVYEFIRKIDYNFSLVPTTEDGWMISLYDNVKQFFQQFQTAIPQHLEAEIQKVLKHIEMFLSPKNMDRIQKLIGIVFSEGSITQKGKDLLASTGNLLSLGNAGKEIVEGARKTISAGKQGKEVIAGIGKSGSKLMPALSVVGNAIFVFVNIYELISLVREKDFENTKEGKDLNNIIGELQTQEDELEDLFDIL